MITRILELLSEIGLTALLAIVIQRIGKLKAIKTCLLTKRHKTEIKKILRRAQIVNIKRQSVQLKGHQKDGISTSSGNLDQTITSEEVEVSDTLVNFIKSSDHGVVHFDLLQKHKNLAIYRAPCRNWQNFDVQAFAENIVALIDRDNPENVRNSVLTNEVNYVIRNHPLNTKYVQNHTRPFFDDELRTMKRFRRKFEKACQKNGNSEDKSRFIKSVLVYFELITKKKCEYLDQCVTRENKRVRYSIFRYFSNS